MSTPSVSISTPSVPLELQFLILDHFNVLVTGNTDNTKSKRAKLQGLALICSAWAAHIQSLLFRQISLDSNGQCARFHSVLSANPHLGQYVTGLSTLESVAFTTPGLQELLPNVVASWLALGNIVVDCLSIELASPEDQDAAAFNVLLSRVGHALKELEVTELSDVVQPVVGLCLTPCQTLRSLTLHLHFSTASSHNMRMGLLLLLQRASSSALATLTLRLCLTPQLLDLSWAELDALLAGQQFGNLTRSCSVFLLLSHSSRVRAPQTLRQQLGIQWWGFMNEGCYNSSNTTLSPLVTHFHVIFSKV
ncbi:hypothetical protein B0H17DRAFT_1221767 [Mycena rosella]|uniref:Uncharacterized protein n=1 Tax=Mycena rosella TaxID=1033263 RepID=A0AAD7B0G1_MYCRO|nr:hypothetical protein B0H17DRAFT_1221767 [Mycena rosella]